MIDVKTIDKLASLARIDVPESEKETLAKEISSILTYVEQVQKISGQGDKNDSKPQVRNIFREDRDSNISGENTKDILEEVPSRHENFVKVKKIL